MQTPIVRASINPCVCLDDGATFTLEDQYREHIIKYPYHRIIPKDSGSIVTITGLTRK